MKPGDITAFLSRHKRIAIDTSPFIYHLTGDVRYTAFTGPLFSWIERRKDSAVTSTITMVELLTGPYSGGDQAQADAIYALGSRFPNLSWVAPTLAIADRAAWMRARHRLRTPDAIQLATAIEEKATAFVSNDTAFRRATELEVFQFE